MQTLDETFPTVPSSQSLATKDYPISVLSSSTGEITKKPDAGNIEEAELSLRETTSLNYEEARALLGRIEFQKGNVEAALHVFEGIDIASATPKMKATLAGREERHKKHPKDVTAPQMSIHAVSLLFEAIFLKAKSLQHLRKFKEAAQACKVILDIVECSLPEGFPENFSADLKLQEIITKAVELLPELWKHADCPQEAILSYRKALLNHWNLDAETTAKIQLDFSIFLLYSGCEASSPTLRSQMDSSFVPRNNIEEAILLLMILLRKVCIKRIEWDPSILDHLSFALSIAGDLRALAKQVEELPPGIINRKERYHLLALCYYGAGEDLVALDLFRKLLSSREDPNCLPALLMASKICCEHPHLAKEGLRYASTILENLEAGCHLVESTANCLLGLLFAAHSKSAISDSERFTRQSKALQALEKAGRITEMKDPVVLYHLSLENAEQRKLDAALYYATSMLKLEGGSNVRGWLLLARILSAQKQFAGAETIISAALDQTGKWDQGELLRTKAKLQIAQGQLKRAIETYTQLLAILQVQSKGYGSQKKLHKSHAKPYRSLELEVWHDLAYVYISLSQWGDAEACLSRSAAISPNSAARLHATGELHRRKGLHKQALIDFSRALDIDPSHAPSLIAIAEILREAGCQPNAVVRSLLMNALRYDRTNSSAWYNLALVHKAEGTASSMQEAAECFQAAAVLQESIPIEPFR